MLWNEPNNLSHWDFKDRSGVEDVCGDGDGRQREPFGQVNPELKIVLGGISPIDPHFIELLTGHGVIDDGRRGRGARLPAGLEPLEAFTTGRRRWTRFVPSRASRSGCQKSGASSFGAEEVQVFGMKRRRSCCWAWWSAFTGTACSIFRAVVGDHAPQGSGGQCLLPALLHGPAARGWLAETGGGVFPPKAWESASGFTSKTIGWRSAVEWLRRLGVQHLRTGVSWADWYPA